MQALLDEVNAAKLKKVRDELREPKIHPPATQEECIIGLLEEMKKQSEKVTEILVELKLERILF
jgi:hypothetical protein